MLKKSILLLALLCSPVAFAKEQWFGVVGDAEDPLVDTVEVDPTTVTGTGNSRSMRIRVSRSGDRVSTDGVRFRSFVAEVSIDCATRRGRFVSVEFFALPGWAGEPYGKTSYASNELRPMLFREIQPNPKLRIIRAACQSYRVQTR